MIKRVPEDFRVEERLAPAFLATVQGSGPFALYRLQKEHLTTPAAVGQMAAAFNMHAGAFAYAGLKDKHARTTQHLTLKLGDGGQAPPAGAGTGWKALRLGFVPRAITPADINRNYFRITVWNLSAEGNAVLETNATALALKPAGLPGLPDQSAAVPGPVGLIVVNYFGEQRFGAARHERGFAAKALAQGRFEEALQLAIATEARKDTMKRKIFCRTLRAHWGHWREALAALSPSPERKAVERLAASGGDFRAAFCALPYLQQQLNVLAYQAFLWNEMAAWMVRRWGGAAHVTNTPFGDLVFPFYKQIAPEMRDLEIPTLAAGVQLEPPWAEAAAWVLQREGLKLDDLRIVGVRRPEFRGERRRLFFAAEEFQLSPLLGRAPHLHRTISCLLPPGAYATILLRALGQ